MSVFGYARVSTVTQKTDRQTAALIAAGVPSFNIYYDKQSGKDFQRDDYLLLMARLKKGDVLFIKSIDRLVRNYHEILEQWRIITQERGCDVVVLDMPLIDTRQDKNLLGTFISDLVLQILAFVAENERAYILERQRDGIAVAKARGVKFGRPQVKRPDNFDEVAKLVDARQLQWNDAARMTGLKKTTFRRHFEKWKRANDEQ